MESFGRGNSLQKSNVQNSLSPISRPRNAPWRSLVRDVPLDRRAGELVPDESGAALVLNVPRSERARVEALLRNLAGPTGGT